MPTTCINTVKKEERLLDCLALFCCGFCLCGLQRSHIQKTIGVEDDGLVCNCLMHCCILSCFSLVQEYRGVLRWRKETSSGFKAKWKESGKHWWDSAIITISNLDME
jgi:hypothetical protein